jgi:hypothetical protein
VKSLSTKEFSRGFVTAQNFSLVFVEGFSALVFLRLGLVRQHRHLRRAPGRQRTNARKRRPRESGGRPHTCLRVSASVASPGERPAGPSHEEKN